MTRHFDEEEARVVSANTGLISGRQSLDQLAERIGVEHKAAYGAAREALEHARAAGQLLTEAKQLLPHGQWLPWLKANFEFTARTAQGYMRLVERWAELGGKCETVSHLGLREALALLAQPKEIQPHEYCSLFPPMKDWEYEGLKRSLKSNGFFEHSPITLFEGKILDGKERYRACLELGVEPKFQTYEDVIAEGYFRGSPLDFVIAGNIFRQHLSEDQRAMIVAKIDKDDPCCRGLIGLKDALGELGNELPNMEMGQVVETMKFSEEVINTVHGIKIDALADLGGTLKREDRGDVPEDSLPF